MTQKQIVVAGGGTAGWMAALLARHQYPNADVTVVASNEIGILGAGEGTTPHFLEFLAQVNIPVERLVKKCKATFKVGISFDNWNGDGEAYFHPFSYQPGLDLYDDNEGAMVNNLLHSKQKLTMACLGHMLCKNKKAPYRFRNRILANPLENRMLSFELFSVVGVHFDARLLADELKTIGVERNIRHVDDLIVDAVQDEAGYIKSLVLQRQQLDVDFLFDATGFAHKFIGKLFGAEWDSYAAYLPMKEAVPFFVPHNNDVEPMTLAKAMRFGWMWRIPVEGRFGCGYVYDSDYINADQAVQEIESTLGFKVESPRKFTFSPGSYKTPLIKNCLAVGLSQGFVEPLEATSLWVTYMTLLDMFSMELFAERNEHVTKAFNEKCNDRNTEVAHFLHAHYLSSRSDSPFWSEFKTKNKSPEAVKTRLAELEFNGNFNLSEPKFNRMFGNKSWIVVSNGVGLPVGYDANKTLPTFLAKAYINNVRQMALSCLSHKEILDYLRA